jgi:hypothetical protein
VFPYIEVSQFFQLRKILQEKKMQEETKTNNEENYDKDSHTDISVYPAGDIYDDDDDDDDKIMKKSHQEPPIGGGGGESFFIDVPQDYYRLQETTPLSGTHYKYDIKSVNSNIYEAISKVAIVTETKDGAVTYRVYDVSNTPNRYLQLRLWLSKKKDPPANQEPNVIIGNDNGVSILTDKKLNNVKISKKIRSDRFNYAGNKESVVRWELYDSNQSSVSHSGEGDDMYHIYVMFYYPHSHPADKTSKS